MNQKMQVAAPHAEKVKLSWVDVNTQVQHCLNLLNNHGADVLNVVNGTMKLVSLAVGRDFPGVFAQLNQEYVDIKALKDAIAAEFNISPTPES